MSVRVVFGIVALVVGSLATATAWAQDVTPPAKTSGKYRRIVPGVEKTISPDLRSDEVASQHNLIELLANAKNIGWKPKQNPNSRTLQELATGTTFRQNVFCLEFTFKPPRMIWVDMPTDTGKMQRKLIWYLLYHVRNVGGQLKPVKQDDGTFKTERVAAPVTFDPHFVLESIEYRKAYLDRVIPVAVEAIRQKEDPNRPLLNSAEMAAKPIPPSTERTDNSVWGVATWEDVDPRIDFFVIDVQGLSNAMKWIDPPGAYQKGDPPGKGRILTQKTLRLNFWRPGDEYTEDERITQFGIPGKVDYEWVYR